MSPMGKLTSIDLWIIMNKKSDVKGICSPLKGNRGVLLSVELQ